MNEQKIGNVTPATKGWPCIKQVSYINLSVDLHSTDNFTQIHNHTLTQEIGVSVFPAPHYYLISSSHTHLPQPNQRPAISLPLPLFKLPYLHTYTSSPGLWTVTSLHKPRGSWQQSAAGLLEFDWLTKNWTGVNTVLRAEREREVLL